MIVAPIYFQYQRAKKSHSYNNQLVILKTLASHYIYCQLNTTMIISVSEMEHGYASTLPMPEDYDLKKTKLPNSSIAKKSQGTR